MQPDRGGLGGCTEGGASGQAATISSPSTLSPVLTALAPVAGCGGSSLGQVAPDVRYAGALPTEVSPEALGGRQGQVAPDPLVSAAVGTAAHSGSRVMAGGAV